MRCVHFFFDDAFLFVILLFGFILFLVPEVDAPLFVSVWNELSYSSVFFLELILVVFFGASKSFDVLAFGFVSFFFCF